MPPEIKQLARLFIREQEPLTAEHQDDPNDPVVRNIERERGLIRYREQAHAKKLRAKAAR